MKIHQLISSGTFDLFHKGHKSFLEKSFENSNEAIVCITSNAYVKSFKDSKNTEDFEVRKNAVEQFLKSIGAIDRAKIISIEDIYGPLLTSEYDPQAIAVTSQNEKNAIKINGERIKRGLPSLKIIIIPMDKSVDGKEISSTRIRNGEINRNGRLYVRKDWKSHSLVLPQNLRPLLQKPFGKVLNPPPSGLDAGKTITIGDISTQKFNQAKVGQFLSVVDFKVHRQKMFDELSELGFDNELETITVENSHGTITPQLFEAVRKAFQTKDRKIILVKGEEDLAFLPTMLLAPLGFYVYYGQPNQGVVEVAVTEENKEKIYDLVSKFTQQT